MHVEVRGQCQMSSSVSPTLTYGGRVCHLNPEMDCLDDNLHEAGCFRDPLFEPPNHRHYKQTTIVG